MISMSKLSDRIKRAGRASSAPAPMGFNVSTVRRAEATMLTVVRIADAGKIGEAVAKGADVVIVEKADAGKIQKEAGKTSGASIGAPINGGGKKEAVSLREAGADFLLLDIEGTLAEALIEEKVGFVLPVGLDADEIELRLLGDMPLDALLVPGIDGRLTLRDAMRLRRVAGLARTPLMMPVDPGIEEAALQALRDCGVVGVVVDGSSLGKLDKLRETIGKLRPRGRRREESPDATISAGSGSGEDEDWDEDDF